MFESSRLTATDLMTRDVVTARPDTKLEVVIRQMLDGGNSGMPVVDADGRAIAMITEGDLIRWSEEAEPDPLVAEYARRRLRLWPRTSCALYKTSTPGFRR